LFDLARAYDRLGQADSALAIYQRAVTTPDLVGVFHDAIHLAPAYRRLGELSEARGDVVNARAYYARFVDLWERGDAELQPLVRDARARLVRLAAERAP
jgi:tetratricopeptide (TPR) repeat protein